MTSEHSPIDEKLWNERVNQAAVRAAEEIFSLPPELRDRALAVFTASFGRELKPLPQPAARGYRYGRRFTRQR